MTWTTRCCWLVDVRRRPNVVPSCALTVFEEHCEIGFLRFAVGVVLPPVNSCDDALVAVVVAAGPGIVFRRNADRSRCSQRCLKMLL